MRFNAVFIILLVTFSATASAEWSFPVTGEGSDHALGSGTACVGAEQAARTDINSKCSGSLASVNCQTDSPVPLQDVGYSCHSTCYSTCTMN